MAFIYPLIRSRQEGSNAHLVDSSESDLIQMTRFLRTAVNELWCQLIADDLVRPTDHVTYASPTIAH